MDQVSLTKAFYWKRCSEVDASNHNDVMAQQVGWQSHEMQRLCFDVATTLADIDWTQLEAVLDIGCGVGQLVKYLREQRSFRGQYTGIDMIPGFVNRAHKLYGNDPRNIFMVGDFLNQNFDNRRYDFIFCLGALGINYDQPHTAGEKSIKYAETVIQSMSQLTSLGMSLYFPKQEHLTNLVGRGNPDMAFYKSSEIEKMLRCFTGERLKSFEQQSFPTASNTRTIVKVVLSQPTE